MTEATDDAAHTHSLNDHADFLICQMVRCQVTVQRTAVRRDKITSTANFTLRISINHTHSHSQPRYAVRPLETLAPLTHSLVWVDSFYLSVVEVLVYDVIVGVVGFGASLLRRCLCIIFCPGCRGDLHYRVRHFVVQMVLSSSHACA